MAKSIFDFFSQNETFNSTLLNSVKLMDLFTYKNFGFYLGIISIFATLTLIFYIVKQLKSKNYIYSFLLLLPLSMSSFACGITGWTIHADMNNHVVSEISISKPEKIKKMDSSTYYYVSNDIYAVNNKCKIDISKPLVIYKTSRKNQYIGNAFDDNCVYTLMSKEYGEGL